MPVRERAGRSRHGTPLISSLFGWHAKFCSRLPLLLIASCCFLSVVLQWRLLLPLIVNRDPPYPIQTIPTPGWPVPVDARSVLARNFMEWSPGELDELTAAENLRLISQAEEEEIEERSEPNRRIWEVVSRNVRRSDKEELHERDDGELERSGQPLCIYETYSGSDAWPHLHKNKSLYRGLSLSTKIRRLGGDDVEALLRLPSLNKSYFLDLLCDSAGLFAIAHRIDRVHKNDWIGFQPWQAAVRKVALSDAAEAALTERVTNGADGDALYFWAPIGVDVKPRARTKFTDFWTLCDTLNGGNCRSVFLQTFKQMYGLPEEWTLLPSMASESDLWSGMQCWVMPTSSFVELVMFSRMFVDALYSLYHTAHHDFGICNLGAPEVRHCYCNLLEGLVNVWAYHSARKFIFVNQETGFMEEVHALASRQGQMWVKWFELPTLKAMDEDLAEFVDRNGTADDWLWPKTGEVFWQGIVDRERLERLKEKEDRKKKLKERIAHMGRQKSVGRYVKSRRQVGHM